ncbi:MAG: hypothetical protein MAG715_01133 [Methanonatronarchaeales archaeon]|nr:hypothetical protein [Methanonatronarchaeales archaeon]
MGSLEQLMAEFRTLHYRDRPSGIRPDRMLAMFGKGGSFRGAVHAFSRGTGGTDVWLLLDGGVPVAGIGKKEGEVVAGREALEAARVLDHVSFTRLSEDVFERLFSRGQATPARIRTET